MPSPSLDLKPDQLLSRPCAAVSWGGCSPLDGQYQAVALRAWRLAAPSVLPLECPKGKERIGPLSSTQEQVAWDGSVSWQVRGGMAELGEVLS